MNYTPDEALKAAVAIGGGQKRVAEALGISQAAVSQWMLRGRLPVERVLQLERLTGGKVPRGLLRPDIYPEDRQAD